MVDIVSAERRSAMMARIRGRDTKPEIAVRSMLHRMGYRFRLHDSRLPGTPDLVMPGRKTAVFVHGCFWHRHSCKLAYTPKSRTDFWLAKFEQTRRRDRNAIREIRKAGWLPVIVWECELRDAGKLGARLRCEIEQRQKNSERAWSAES